MAFLAFSSAFLDSWIEFSTSAWHWAMSASSFFLMFIRLVFYKENQIPEGQVMLGHVKQLGGRGLGGEGRKPWSGSVPHCHTGFARHCFGLDQIESPRTDPRRACEIIE